MRRSIWAMALAIFSMALPMAAPAAEKRVIVVTIVNERNVQVKAQSPHLENCFPNLSERIEPNGSYRFDCKVWDESKKTSFVVRLVLPDDKIGCEGFWNPSKVSVTYENNGARCAITTLGTDNYRLTIR